MFQATTELILGECRAKLASFTGASFDAVITDPPYSSGGMTRSDRMGQPSKKYVQTGTQLQRPDFPGDNRDQRSFLLWSVLWMEEAFRVARDGAPICVFTDWRQLPSVTDALQVAGWVWRGIVVWDKTGSARPCMGRYTNQAEYVVWGSKGPMPRERGVGVLPGVFRHPVRQADKFHMTGKPTPLMQEIVRIVPAGSHVLDPFMGSGSTGAGCLLEGLSFTGIELDPVYYDVAAKRLHGEERAAA